MTSRFEWANSRCTKCGAAVRVGRLGRSVIVLQQDEHGSFIAVQLDVKTGDITVERIRDERSVAVRRNIDRFADHTTTCAARTT